MIETVTILWRSYEDLMKIPWRSNEDLQGLERILRRSWRWDAITRDSLRPFESNLVTNPSSGALLLFWFATNYTTNVTIPSPNTNQRVYDSFTTVVHFSSRYIIIFNDNQNITFTEFRQNLTLSNPLKMLRNMLRVLWKMVDIFGGFFDRIDPY